MQIGKTSLITFKVGVVGTTAEPTVRVVLASQPGLYFPAKRRGDDWMAYVDVPVGIKPGSYELRIEVIVANRLFCPLVKVVELRLDSVDQVMALAKDLEQVDELPVDLSTEVPSPAVELPAELPASIDAEQAKLQWIEEVPAPIVPVVSETPTPTPTPAPRAPVSLIKLITREDEATAKPTKPSRSKPSQVVPRAEIELGELQDVNRHVSKKTNESKSPSVTIEKLDIIYE